MNIEKIKKEYNIDSDDLNEIRSILLDILKASHPDSSKDKFNKEYYFKVQKDLDYVKGLIKSKQDQESLVPISEIKDLINFIKNSNDETPTKEKTLKENIDKSINEHFEIINKKRRRIKFSSASFTVIIAFLWLFPERVVQHPIMQLYFGQFEWDETKVYITIVSIVWLFSIFFTCAIWAKCMKNEYLEKRAINLIKNERAQNSLFMEFVSNLNDQKFSKQQFYDFITDDKVSPHYISLNDMRKHKNDHKIFNFNNLFDEEVYSNIIDIIILRAESKDIISKINNHSFIDEYELLMSEEEINRWKISNVIKIK